MKIGPEHRRGVIGRLVENERAEQSSSLRRLVVGGAKLVRKALLQDRLDEFGDVVLFKQREEASWVAPDAVLDGGPFDACDLRHWLIIAEEAGVPAVPAREILSLDDNEITSIERIIPLPDVPAVRLLRKGMIDAARSVEADEGVDAKNLAAYLAVVMGTEPLPGIAAAVMERCYEAMDGVPEGWMVRSNRTGPSELKAFAGLGWLPDGVQGVQFGPDLEVGPGWIRDGNRRRVNATDGRIVADIARGPGGAVYMARPWARPGRTLRGVDPHIGSGPFAELGRWPAEWRVYVRDGVVTGVSAYYGWAETASPIAARGALEAVEAATRMVAVVAACGAHPRFMTAEFARRNALGIYDEEFATLPRDGVSCTLDFLETPEGPVLLEGGPPCLSFDGGHPLSFAGVGRCGPGQPFALEGVAFAPMEGVIVADPRTWIDRGAGPRPIDFEQAVELARDAGYEGHGPVGTTYRGP